MRLPTKPIVQIPGAIHSSPSTKASMAAKNRNLFAARLHTDRSNHHPAVQVFYDQVFTAFKFSTGLTEMYFKIASSNALIFSFGTE